MSLHERLRDLPSVDEIIQRLDARCPRDLLVAETRRAIDEMRERMRRGEHVDVSSVPQMVLQGLDALERKSLRRVINATGVILHTNLGRAPLPPISSAGGYSNLEFDTETGRRGKRDVHVSALIERVTGKPGIVVNNNAAAVFLVLNELAAGSEVIVSRGELIEIGDGFRIPDIMARSGAILREVGTTNRTRIEDYREAITERTRLLMRVHPSNFHVTGFTAKPRLDELAELSRERAIPLYEDLGSGLLADLSHLGIDEPTVAQSIRAGVSLVSFSGDKLLGGPQAGIIAGESDLVGRVRRNPLFRAFRVDKLIYSALESTLRHVIFCRWDEIPAIRMASISAERILQRAEALASRLSQLDVDVRPNRSLLGGGSTPDRSLPTYVVAITSENVATLEKKLRGGEPPVIARVEDDRLLIDLRTVDESEEDDLVAALQARSR